MCVGGGGVVEVLGSLACRVQLPCTSQGCEETPKLMGDTRLTILHIRVYDEATTRSRESRYTSIRATIVRLNLVCDVTCQVTMNPSPSLNATPWLSGCQMCPRGSGRLTVHGLLYS